MDKELKELLIERQKMLNVELTDQHWDKLKGEETEAGNKCKIVWKDWDEDDIDEGYLFDLPIGNSSDEGDIFIHVPKPLNPSGIGTPPAVFLHLYNLITNEMVKSITIIK